MIFDWMKTIPLSIKVPGIWTPEAEPSGFGLAPMKMEGGGYRLTPWTLWDVSYAVPNGIQIGGGRAARGRYMSALKARGLKPGVSDIVIAYPVGRFHGMYLELKRDAKSEISDEQVDWKDLMNAVGYHAVIAVGLQHAIVSIGNYLNDRHRE